MASKEQLRELLDAAKAAADDLADLSDPATGIIWKLDPSWSSALALRIRRALVPFRDPKTNELKV